VGRYRDILENLEGRVESYYRSKKAEQLAPSFLPSAELDAIVKPKERYATPLSRPLFIRHTSRALIFLSFFLPFFSTPLNFCSFLSGC
jgi:hypothetical protein